MNQSTPPIRVTWPQLLAASSLYRLGLWQLSVALPALTCTEVVVLVEAVPTGRHTLSLLHQQRRQARWTLQSTGACGALGLAGFPQTRWRRKKWDQRLDPNPEALGHKQFFRLNSSCQALCNGFVAMDALICTTTLRSRHDQSRCYIWESSSRDWITCRKPPDTFWYCIWKQTVWLKSLGLSYLSNTP